MKATEAVSGTLITTGTGTVFTFQGFMQIAGLMVAIAGLLIGFLNWKENKRRNDISERENAKTSNSKKE